METLDGARGRDADGRNEDLCAVTDGDLDELVELAVGVVVVGLASAAADLWEG